MPTGSNTSARLAGVTPRARPTNLLLILALAVVTALAYTPVLRAGFVWDDDFMVTQNPRLRSWQGLSEIWFSPGATLQYYPMTFTAWWVQYQLWGLAPLGYHVVNVLLHAANSAVLWLVLRRLGIAGAWMAAAVFAVHPVHVESVAWISELKNVLSGFLYLLAALAYLTWALGERAAPHLYALALLCCAGALLSKTVTCTLPVALFLIVWWRRGRLVPSDVVALLPFVVVSGAAALHAAWLERHYVGAAGDEWVLTFADRCLIAGRALWFYAAKIVWPANLSFIYERWTLDPQDWRQWVFPVSAVAALGTLAALRRWSALVAVLFFVVTVSPALGFVDFYPMRFSFVADHFQYLASIGLITLLVSLVAVGSGRLPPVARCALIALVVASLAHVAARQARVYETAETLWRATIAQSPSAWMAHNNLGLVLYESGRLPEAEDSFRTTLRLRPGYPEAIYNLGNVLAGRGLLREAAEQYEAALRIDDRFARVHNNLGNVRVLLGEVEEGRRHYERALALDPDYADARRNLAILDQRRRPGRAE